MSAAYRGRERLLASLAIAILTTACPHPLPVLKAPPIAATTRDVVLENGFLTIHLDIPTTPIGPKPAIISFLEEPDALLAAGMVVVQFTLRFDALPRPASPLPTPAVEHPVGSWLLAAPTPKTVGKGYFELINVNATFAVPRVLDYLAGVPEVDTSRLGIVGFSTNGFVALQALASDARLTAGAVLFACGDYHRFLHLSTLAMNGERLDLDPTFDRWLHEREPIRQPERLVHAAILTVNGTDDHTIPLACAEESVRVFRDTYQRVAQGERYRSVFIHGVGHDLTGEVARETVAWFRRWLGGSP